MFSSKIGEIRYIFRSRFALIETYEATQRPRGALYIISCTQEGFVLDVYFIYSSSNCFLLKTSHKTSLSRHISGFTFEIYTNSFTQLFKVTSKLPLVAYFYLKKHPHKIHCVDTFEGSCLMSTPTVLVNLSIKLNGKVRWSHSIIWRDIPHSTFSRIIWTVMLAVFTKGFGWKVCFILSIKVLVINVFLDIFIHKLFCWRFPRKTILSNIWRFMLEINPTVSLKFSGISSNLRCVTLLIIYFHGFTSTFCRLVWNIILEILL